jgi:hypothetical protein
MMNQYTRYFFLLGIVLGCALLFPACPSPAGDNGSETVDDDDGWDDNENSASRIPEGITTSRTVTLNKGWGQVRYFSLAMGKEITESQQIASQAWDIAFQNSRMILTNSGVTAKELRTGGRGGVWYTDKPFAEARWEDRVTDDPIYIPYETDTYRFAQGMVGMTYDEDGNQADTTRRKMNVFTFIGYLNENEPGVGLSEEHPFSMSYLYNKKAFYSNLYPASGGGFVTPMPANFYATNQVYIIRHGDGRGYSKFEVTQFGRDWVSFIDIYYISWENFFPEDE